MPLAPGSRLGPYEVLGLLGAGGMGEVYRAADTRLHRDVALKVLPDLFAKDADRLARFQREAQVLASLNHAHIAAIYGIEQSDGVQALVLELVEGPTLADRLAGGPLPFDEAMPIAHQIADALEAAHEHGIIHRDLKPANIKVRDDGTVKVLDFGLAKAIDAATGQTAASAPLAAAPTITSPALMTGLGVILGTAAYMAPEQAKGKPADRRSDVWAFGCVVYEMLTGLRAFEGDDVSDTLASVLRAEPRWSALPADTPEAIRRLLRRSLEKDRRRRLADIGVARLEIDDALTTPRVPAQPGIVTPVPIAPRPLWKRAVPLLLTAIVVGSLAALAAWTLKPPPTPSVLRSRFVVPEGQQSFPLGRRQSLAVSPDGTQMVYVASQRLYLRTMSDFDARVIPGTETQQGNVSYPVFSPDGRSIAFFMSPAPGTFALQKIAVTGGVVETIARIRSTNYGLSWSADGILLGGGREGILRVSANGGEPARIVTANDDEALGFPVMVPGGKAVVFTVTRTGDRDPTPRIAVQPLPDGPRQVLVEDGSNPHISASGHLIYALGSALFAAPFDSRRLQIGGERVPVVDGVERGALGEAHYSVSDTGTLVFSPASVSSISPNARELALIDRSGNIERLKAPAGGYVSPRLSPNGQQVALAIEESLPTLAPGAADIYIHELNGSSPMQRLTFGGRNRYPIWTNDGARVAFQSDREGDVAIFWQRADTPGTAERLTRPEKDVRHIPESWSPNGDGFLLSAITAGAGASLLYFSMADKKATPVGNVRSSTQLNAAFSPDGRWVTYTVRTSGESRATVFVEPFPPTGARYQVYEATSSHHSAWSPDGKELSYRTASNSQVVVPISTEAGALRFGNSIRLPGEYPVIVFGGARNYDITRDGKRFLVAAPITRSDATPLLREILIANHWFEELRQRVAAAR